MDKFQSYGYTKGKTPLILDSKMMHVYVLVSKNCPSKESLYFCNYIYDLYSLSTDSFLFLKKVGLELHDIPYLSVDSLLENRIDEDIINLCSSISPFDLPVYYMNDLLFNGKLSKMIINGEKTNIVFLAIGLSRDVNKLILPAYIHEIVHTQVDSNIGIVQDYQDTEILPIFMEKLVSYTMDKTGGLLKNVEEIRFLHLLKSMSSLMIDKDLNDEDAIEASMYIVSTLKALKLFDLYLYGDSDKVLSGVQNVFDGKLSLDSFLDSFGVDLESSSDKVMIKRHLA